MDIVDILAENYSYGEIFSCEIDFNEAIFSSGFVHALELGLVPDLNKIEETGLRVRHGEYHHVIYEDKCYNVYFKEEE